MALRMSQMMRSSREVRKAGPREQLLSSRNARAKEGGAADEDSIIEDMPEVVVAVPVPAAPVAPAAAAVPEETEEEAIVMPAPETALEVYRELVAAGQQVFEAAAEGKAPESNSIIAATRLALKELQQGDDLLAESVRQHRDVHSWAERAANVAIFSIRLGMEIDYDERRCLALGLCALMHDVGMLSIPQEVLDSPQLTEQQFKLLRQHPVESQKMVQSFGKAFSWIGKIVVQVHERQDGSGYPRGLKEDQIHEVARILGLADTYEAMSHARADRKARVTYHALKEIIDLRNSHFDRKLIKALIHIVSIFPLGSLVKLNNGEVGRVIRTSRMHPTRPTVEILLDPRAQKVKPPGRVDLEDEPMLYIVDPAIDEAVLE